MSRYVRVGLPGNRKSDSNANTERDQAAKKPRIILHGVARAAREEPERLAPRLLEVKFLR